MDGIAFDYKNYSARYVWQLFDTVALLWGSRRLFVLLLFQSPIYGNGYNASRVVVILE